MKKSSANSTPNSAKKGGQSSLLSFFSPASKTSTQGPASSPLSKKSVAPATKSIETPKSESPLSPTKPDRVNRQKNSTASSNRKHEEESTKGKNDPPLSDGSESLPTPGSDRLSSPVGSQTDINESAATLHPPSSPVAPSDPNKRVSLSMIFSTLDTNFLLDAKKLVLRRIKRRGRRSS